MGGSGLDETVNIVNWEVVVVAGFVCGSHFCVNLKICVGGGFVYEDIVEMMFISYYFFRCYYG